MTWTAAAIALSVVGGFVSAAGAQQQASAQAAAANRDAAIADRNAKIVDQDRQQAIRTAQIAAEDKRRENRRNFAAIRAAYGSSGFELTGSPLDVLSDTSIEMALDERRVEYEGTVRNREGALQMLYLNEDAQQSRMLATQYKKAGRQSAMSSLLSAGTNASIMAAS